jgi:hypothetical protein
MTVVDEANRGSARYSGATEAAAAENALLAVEPDARPLPRRGREEGRHFKPATVVVGIAA